MGKKAVGYLMYNFLILFSVAGLGLVLAVRRAAVVNPLNEDGWTLLGLAMPLVITLNVFLLIYWAVRRKIWFLIPVAALALGWNSVACTFQLRTSPMPERPADVRIATYNVHGFRGGLDEQATLQRVARMFREQGADIVCLQEMTMNHKRPLDTIAAAFSYLPHYVRVDRNGVVIFSRYPILASEFTPFKHTENSALWADLDIEGQRVRVLVAHLQTTGVSSAQRVLAKQDELHENQEAVRRMGQAIRINGRMRAAQVTLLRRMLDTLSGPVIVCGDFNDTPSTYTYHAMKGSLEDGFRTVGRGWGGTFRLYKSLLRLDYILYDKRFTPVRYYALDAPFSDHRPVFFEFDLPKR